MNPEESFPFEAKRALVQLLRGPVVSQDAHRQIWSAILTHRTEIERRLADVFLDLVLDEDDGIAFTRPQPAPDDPRLAPPQVLRTETLTFMDTLVVLALRYQLLVAPPGQRVIVDYEDIAADMDPYRGRYTTDAAGFRKRINASWEKIKEVLSGLRRGHGGPVRGVTRASPAVRRERSGPRRSRVPTALGRRRRRQRRHRHRGRR